MYKTVVFKLSLTIGICLRIDCCAPSDDVRSVAVFRRRAWLTTRGIILLSARAPLPFVAGKFQTAKKQTRDAEIKNVQPQCNPRNLPFSPRLLFNPTLQPVFLRNQLETLICTRANPRASANVYAELGERRNENAHTVCIARRRDRRAGRNEREQRTIVRNKWTRRSR